MSDVMRLWQFDMLEFSTAQTPELSLKPGQDIWHVWCARGRPVVDLMKCAFADQLDRFEIFQRAKTLQEVVIDITPTRALKAFVISGQPIKACFGQGKPTTLVRQTIQ